MAGIIFWCLYSAHLAGFYTQRGIDRAEGQGTSEGKDDSYYQCNGTCQACYYTSEIKCDCYDYNYQSYYTIEGSHVLFHDFHFMVSMRRAMPTMNTVQTTQTMTMRLHLLFIFRNWDGRGRKTVT